MQRCFGLKRTVNANWILDFVILWPVLLITLIVVIYSLQYLCTFKEKHLFPTAQPCRNGHTSFFFFCNSGSFSILSSFPTLSAFTESMSIVATSMDGPSTGCFLVY